MTTDAVVLGPSPVALAPSFREWIIARYHELADGERELGRLDRWAYCMGRAEALSWGGTASLASLLEAI